jgi:hypothetical protein
MQTDLVDEDLTVKEWRHIVERSLTFQRYVLRRAWGVYFGMTGAVIALFIYLAMAGLDAIAGLVTGLTILIILLAATFLLFRKAYRTVELRQTVQRNRWERRQRMLVLPGILTFFALVIVAAVFLSSYFYLVLYAAEIPLLLIPWYGLRISFPEKLPIEAVLAMSFYGFTIVVSFILSFIGTVLGGSTSVGSLWIAAVLVFFFASVYALLRAPDELEVLVRE